MNYSVLLSVYIKENPEYLEECLKSVFNSSVPSNDVVIVKDGPLTEELDKILESYANKYDSLNIVPLEKNCGLGIALNHGLAHCKNELVARMDTDDICEADRFESQLKVFENDPDASVVGGYITEFIDTPDNIVSTRKVPLTFEELKQYGKKRNPVNHVTVMFKKQDIIEVGSYQKVKDVGYEDYDLWIRLILAGKKIVNIDKVLVNVRVGRDMYKRRGDKKRLKTALFFRKKLWKVGYYSFFHYIFYSAETIAFCCVPSSVREFLYKKILRK